MAQQKAKKECEKSSSTSALEECGKSSTIPTLGVAQKNAESRVPVQLFCCTTFGPQRMSSNVSIEEVKCFLNDGYRTGFLSGEVKQNWAHDSIAVDYLLAITSLQPSCTEWLTAVSGIRLHPDYVAERYSMRSSTISSFSKFRISLKKPDTLEVFAEIRMVSG